jgi:hypothetical protein
VTVDLLPEGLRVATFSHGVVEPEETPEEDAEAEESFTAENAENAEKSRKISKGILRILLRGLCALCGESGFKRRKNWHVRFAKVRLSTRTC